MTDEINNGKIKPELKNRWIHRKFKQLWRKIDAKLGFLFYTLSSILILMASWAAYANVEKSGWSSDAAAWVQAAGSIAAIAGAAWLAQAETRRARRLRREQNEEAAWYVRFAIVQAQFDCQIIAAELVNQNTPIDKSAVHEWRQRAIVSAIGLSALVGRTDYIHPAVTHVTSNAKVLIDDLVIDLADLRKFIEDGVNPDDELISRIVAPNRALLDLIDLYDARMKGIKLALDDGNDILPIRDWGTWNRD